MAMAQTNTRLLVVDDDLDTSELLESHFRSRGFSVQSFSQPFEALKKIEEDPSLCDLVITDLKMPGMDGIDFVRNVKKFAPKLPIVLMTAHGSVETAVKAIQAGAYDFVVKPLNFSQLGVSVDRGLRVSQLEKENETLRREVRSTWSFEGVIGKSEAIQHVFDLAKRVAKSNANVLITGESGSGKEVIAKAIHNHGNRAKAPFVAINCSAIPDNLLESELFGHSKGAFTGAIDKKLGLFEEATGGVLFLDEIGDMNLSLQTKLLRVLQERKIKRIGENQYRPIDVRIIAATHRNLKQEIEEKKFREDLYYRLCVIPIRVPALRDRPEDILPLAHHFLEKFKTQNGSNVQRFSKEAMERMIRLPWRGNVRELENVVERAVVLCDGEEIGVSDFSEPDARAVALSADGLFQSEIRAETLPTLERFSQRYLEFVLHSVDGVKEKAAQILDIDRKTLYRKTLQTHPEKGPRKENGIGNDIDNDKEGKGALGSRLPQASIRNQPFEHAPGVN